MKSINKIKLILLLASMSIFTHTMETQYANIKPESSWIQVPMNEGKHIQVQAKSKYPAIFWTDSLRGCVATIINLEHNNGDHTIALCHFAPFAQPSNTLYLESFLGAIEHETIKKAECIIIPPGIYENGKIVPVFDKKWNNTIQRILRFSMPTITFEITPYLFNIESSAIKYAYQAGNASGAIINRSQIMDAENKDLLLECHNEKGFTFKAVVRPLLAAIALSAGFLYYTQ